MSDFRFDAVQDQVHRPWPAPSGPWLLRQTWTHLLFAHWPVPAEQLRPLIPDGLELELFDGTAWIGVVPFQMSNVSLRGVPNVPHLSAFPELNVRTYVIRDGKPGVWFFSLDAARLVAVTAARIGIGLPYYWADMSCTCESDTVTFSSSRNGAAGPQAAFHATYGPAGPPQLAVPGTLDYFLTERYCLYSVWASQLRRLEILHAPWPLRPAQAFMATNTMLMPLGLRVSAVGPRVHYADRVDVVAWPPTVC